MKWNGRQSRLIIHLKSCSLARTFSPAAVREQPWRARLTAGSGRSRSFSQRQRSPLSSRRRTRSSFTSTSSRKKFIPRKANLVRRDPTAGSAFPHTQNPASFPLTKRPRCPPSQPGRAPSAPRAAEPPAPSPAAPHGARSARNPRLAVPAPPTPSWLLTGALFTFHFSPVAPPTLTDPSRLTRVWGSGPAEQGCAEPGEEEQGRGAAAAQPRSAPGHGWGTAPLPPSPAARPGRGGSGSRSRWGGRCWPRPAGAVRGRGGREPRVARARRPPPTPGCQGPVPPKELPAVPRGGGGSATGSGSALVPIPQPQSGSRRGRAGARSGAGAAVPRGGGGSCRASAKFRNSGTSTRATPAASALCFWEGARVSDFWRKKVTFNFHCVWNTL